MIAQGSGARFDLNGTYRNGAFDDGAGIVVRGDNTTASFGGKRLRDAPRLAAAAGLEAAEARGPARPVARIATDDRGLP